MDNGIPRSSLRLLAILAALLIAVCGAPSRGSAHAARRVDRTCFPSVGGVTHRAPTVLEPTGARRGRCNRDCSCNAGRTLPGRRPVPVHTEGRCSQAQGAGLTAPDRVHGSWSDVAEPSWVTLGSSNAELLVHMGAQMLLSRRESSAKVRLAWSTCVLSYAALTQMAYTPW
jgi:hypothetical protein